jgi:hypothetical protein
MAQRRGGPATTVSSPGTTVLRERDFTLRLPFAMGLTEEEQTLQGERPKG